MTKIKSEWAKLKPLWRAWEVKKAKLEVKLQAARKATRAKTSAWKEVAAARKAIRASVVKMNVCWASCKAIKADWKKAERR